MQKKINQFSQYPYDKQTVSKIIQIVQQNPQCHNIILQYPKRYLKEAFSLSTYLKRYFNQSTKQSHEQLQIKQQQIQQQKKMNKQFYTLFDSMKNQCCTDIIGAQHIQYDLLIHFGYACFSQPYQKHHYYLFPTICQQLQQKLNQQFNNQYFVNKLEQNKIGFLLVEQNLYQYCKRILKDILINYNIQILKLPYDAIQQDQYLIFGYYAQPNFSKNNNILVFLSQHPQNDNQLLSNIHLTLGSFSKNIKIFTQTPQLYVTCLQVPEIKLSSVNYSKSLMIRMAQIGQIQKYQTFGLLVSNAGTSFYQKTLEKCKQILLKQNKKFFLFMMNNLNQVKLGNFPEIQVYVIISCYNNSCFSQKDFCRLVVAPIDLEVAFNNTSIAEYNFDLSHPKALKQTQQQQYQINNQIKQQKQTISETIPINQNHQIQVQRKKQIMLASTLQTLDYYRGKQYKGLDFSQKKTVQKIKKGKIGLAQQYKPLPQDI